MALSVTFDLYARASGRVDKNRTKGRKAECSTRLEVSADKYPMLHEEPYINCFVITLRMHKPPRV